ncbi:hypothetical protein ACVGVM_00260 [Pseudonocardia bannensis]|uniref:Uncharacterized protein n=1 Tax=Pseudonocardia bannensis TaxID=630973 RepID=A0A848DMP0_9PSEU|nr:hypothetical protein [Pseudonocardia bannensis]NMH93968.1 hypothetical protein [Pseudonocardia bannensis]
MSTLITAAGHLAAGGAAPDLQLLVILFPLFAALVTALADTCRTAAGMLVVLGAGQLGMHVLMEVLAHSHPGAVVVTTGVGVTTMLAMHAVATLVTAAMIRDADHVLLTVFAALRRALPRRITPPPADRPLRTLPVPAPAVVGHTARVPISGLARRGPPVWA